MGLVVHAHNLSTHRLRGGPRRTEGELRLRLHSESQAALTSIMRREMGVVVHACKPALRRQKQENVEFLVRLH